MCHGGDLAMPSRKPKIKVLVVFANPRGTDPLRLGSEAKAIEQSIALSRYRNRISIKILHATTIHDWRRAFLKQEFQIVHVSGHGTDNGLVLENESGDPYVVPLAALAEFLQAYSPPLNCAILNACYSVSQGEISSVGVPYTIAMDGAVSDDAAIEFSRGFYDALGAGRDIDFSYKEGCRTVRLSNQNAQFISKIFQQQTRSSVSEVIETKSNSNVTDSELPDRPTVTSWPEIAHFVVGPPILQPRQFFGRKRELKRIFDLFKLRPFQNTAIIGPKRSGKTSLLYHLKNITLADQTNLRSNQRNDWLIAPENYQWVYIDFQNPRMGNEDGILRHLLTSLNMPMPTNIPTPTPCKMELFLDIIDRYLTLPTVILLDEIGVALQRYQELDDYFWDGLRSLVTAGSSIAFVLASHLSPLELANNNKLSSPFLNVFGFTTTLGPLTELEALELITSSPIPFPDNDVEWILAESKRWPILIQVLCREKLSDLEANKSNEAWREEGKRQMLPFRHLLT